MRRWKVRSDELLESQVSNYSHNNNLSFPDRLTDWQTDRLKDRQTGRLTDWQTNRLADWQTGRLAD